MNWKVFALAGPADPFSVSGDPYALTGGQSGADLRPSGDTDEWFRRLCASSNGVLYEDSCLQVSPLIFMSSVPKALFSSTILWLHIDQWCLLREQLLSMPTCLFLLICLLQVYHP